MKGLIRNSALLAAAAMLSPTLGATEQPQGMVVAAVNAPNTAVWTDRSPDITRVPTRPVVVVPKIERRGDALKNFNVDRSGSSEINEEDAAAAAADDGAYLLPTWDRGFWVMPPGGLTRFLIPARGFINPDQTLVP